MINRLNSSNESTISTQLGILSNLVKGTDPEQFQKYTPDLVKTLEQDHLSLVMNDQHLEKILDVVDVLLKEHQNSVPVIRDELFRICIQSMALASDPQDKIYNYAESTVHILIFLFLLNNYHLIRYRYSL